METKQQYSSYRKVTKRAKILAMVFVFSLISVSVFADDPGTPGGPDPDAPIDGGISLLVAAGVGYGVKKVRRKKKEQENQDSTRAQK